MKKILFLLLFPFFVHSQSIMSTKEMEDNAITISSQSAYIKGTNTVNGAVKLKKIRIDSLLALSAKGVSALIVNKAELSYVNLQLANKTTVSQVNVLVDPKMDSVRTKFLLALKANSSELSDKVSSSTFNSVLSTKANSSDLSLKENTADANAKLGFKVNNQLFADTTTSIRSAINTKASIASVSLKANIASPVFTGTVSGITKTMVGLPLVDNTADVSKPISTLQQVAFNSKLQTVATIATLQAFTDADVANFDGSTWERKSGNVASNGNGFNGTIINVSTSFYWERKFIESVNVAYFGIYPDGVDYSTQIQYVADNFNDITFNKGTYLGFIGIYRSNVKIKGQGSSVTVIKCPNGKMQATDVAYGSGQPNVIEIGHCYMGNSEPAVNSIELTGLTLDGNKSNNTAPSFDVFGWGLAITNMQNSVFKDVNAINCHAGGVGFFINSNYNSGDFKVVNCGFNLGTPGFDFNSSSYNIFSVISRDCKYGGRILDNCWGNILDITVYNATLQGLICNNQSVNESHGNTINFNVRYGCIDNGLSVSTRFNSNKFTGTISDITGVGVKVQGVADGIAEANVPSSNNFNVATNNCGYQSVSTQGYNDIWNISSYQDGTLTNQGDIYAIDIYSKKSQFTINLFDRTTWRVRGVVFRATSSNNKLVSYIYQNTADPFGNTGTLNIVPLEFNSTIPTLTTTGSSYFATTSGGIGVGTTSLIRSIFDIKDINKTPNSGLVNAYFETSTAQGVDVGASIGLGGNMGIESIPFGYIAGRKENSTSGSYAGYLDFSTMDGGGTIASAIRITSAKNIGFGTTTPLAKGDFRGNVHVSDGSGTKTRIRTGGAIDFTNFAENAYASATFNATQYSFLSGNFGVGTSTPSYLLDVAGTAQATIFRVSAIQSSPATATSTGTTGEIRFTSTGVYICTATNTWIKCTGATF